MPYFPPSGGSGSGVTTVGTFSSTSEVNGAAISSSTITFGPADGTNPGMVTTGAQTFAGAKTFTSQISASAGIYVAPSYNIALDSAASIVFSVNNTSTIGTPTSYAQYMYGSRYYLNSTAYIDGGTAGTAALTGNLTVSGGLTSSAGSALTGNVRYNSQINTTSQTITTSQPMFQIGNSTSAITLTLPATTTVGYAYTLTNINTGLVTVVATINGATNYVLSQWQSITVFSTSTSGSWYSANNLATYSAQTNISANYTVLPNDSNIFATGTITVTLPSAVVFGGREITIYNVGTGTITVAATAGTVSIASIAAAGGAPANNSVAYVSNGTNWYTA
jgi:hypothetical protein